MNVFFEPLILDGPHFYVAAAFLTFVYFCLFCPRDEFDGWFSFLGIGLFTGMVFPCFWSVMVLSGKPARRRR